MSRSLRDAPDFYGSSAEVKDWEAQGRDITAEVTCSEKYKSLALHAEVKLAEALERCTRLCPSTYSSDGEEMPNKLKTAVCSQVGAHVLGEAVPQGMRCFCAARYALFLLLQRRACSLAGALSTRGLACTAAMGSNLPTSSRQHSPCSSEVGMHRELFGRPHHVDKHML